MSGSVQTNPGVMELHVSEPKPSGLECKRILTFVIMAVALCSFIALICAQGTLEHKLTTGPGSALTGLLLPFRVAASGAVANVIYFVSQAVPASYCVTLSPCVEQVKELCSGLTATFLGSMSILGVWVRVESVPYVAKRFTPTAKHYRVSELPPIICLAYWFKQVAGYEKQWETTDLVQERNECCGSYNSTFWLTRPLTQNGDYPKSCFKPLPTEETFEPEMKPKRELWSDGCDSKIEYELERYLTIAVLACLAASVTQVVGFSFSLLSWCGARLLR